MSLQANTDWSGLKDDMRVFHYNSEVNTQASSHTLLLLFLKKWKNRYIYVFTMNVFIHVPFNSCSNCSKTWGKAWCCEIWALALVVTVQDVHAKQRRVKQHMSRNTMGHNFSSNNIQMHAVCYSRTDKELLWIQVSVCCNCVIYMELTLSNNIKMYAKSICLT